MKFRWDNKYLHWGVTAFMVIAASMLFYYGIFHMKTLIFSLTSLSIFSRIPLSSMGSVGLASLHPLQVIIAARQVSSG